MLFQCCISNYVICLHSIMSALSAYWLWFIFPVLGKKSTLGFFKGSGFLPVSLHPSSTARQKQNKQTCYLNEMDRYGPASLNRLISVFCKLRWLKADTMLILCLKMSFSLSLHAVYCLTGTVLYSCISIYFFPSKDKQNGSVLICLRFYPCSYW